MAPTRRAQGDPNKRRRVPYGPVAPLSDFPREENRNLNRTTGRQSWKTSGPNNQPIWTPELEEVLIDGASVDSFPAAS